MKTDKEENVLLRFATDLGRDRLVLNYTYFLTRHSALLHRLQRIPKMSLPAAREDGMRLNQGRSSSSLCVRGESTYSKRRFALEKATCGTPAIDLLPYARFLARAALRLSDYFSPRGRANYALRT